MKIIFTIIIIIMAITFQTHYIWAEELYAKSIMEDIKVIGPKKVCNTLYDDEENWNSLLRNIASGDKKWLKVAVSLKEGSDAGSSEMLSLAVGEALENNPENVLKIALERFEINVICGGPDVDDKRYDSYELSIKAINKRIKKVSSIKDKRLQDIRIECLRHLSDAKSGIAKFYQVDDQNP